MKTFKISLFLIAVLATLSSCTQNVEVDIVDPTFAEITTSQSFQAYESFRQERRQLMDQYAVFDVYAYYPSKEAQLAALDESIQAAEQKAALFASISAYINSGEVSPETSEAQALERVVSLIETQEVDDKIKQNVIDFFRFEANHDVVALRQAVLDENPSLDREQLSNLVRRYEAGE